MERIKFNELPEGLIDRLFQIEQFLEESPIDLLLLEIIRLRVAQINRCVFCVDMHYKELKATGESELRLSSLVVWHDTPYFSEKERAVLAFTETLTNLRDHEELNEVYEPLLQFYNKHEIAYLTLAVSQINTWTRLMRTFHIKPGKHKVKEVEVV